MPPKMLGRLPNESVVNFDTFDTLALNGVLGVPN